MPEKKQIDYDLIAKNCQIFNNTDSQIVIENINQLKNNYNDIEMISILNYLLTIVKMPSLLSWIIKELDKYRDSSSLENLTKILLYNDILENTNYTKDEYTNTRVLCAKAISNLKNPSSVHALMYCLNNKNENYKIRLSCADALGKLGNKYAVTSLIDVMSDEEEKSIYVKESAAVALGLIGDMRAVDSLVKVIEPQNGIFDKFSYLKEKAIEALCRLHPNNDRTFKALKNSLKDENPQVRINTLEALLEYDTNEAKELIESALLDKDEEVQRNATIAMFNIHGEEILHAIINNDKYSEACKDEARNILENELDDE